MASFSLGFEIIDASKNFRIIVLVPTQISKGTDIWMSATNRSKAIFIDARVGGPFFFHREVLSGQEGHTLSVKAQHLPHEISTLSAH